MKNKNLAVLLVFFVISACGGETSSTDSGGANTNASSDSGTSTSENSGNGLNNAKSVTGILYTTNGDPIPGATVFISGVTVSKSVAQKATLSFEKTVTSSDGTTCENPPANDFALTLTCSSFDGSFNLDTSGLTNSTQIVFQKGLLRMVQDLNCTADPCILTQVDTTVDVENSVEEIEKEINKKLPLWAEHFDNIDKAFEWADEDGDGKLDEDEVTRMLKDAAVEIPWWVSWGTVSKHLIKKYDKDGDGKLDFGEFIDIIQ